MSDIYTIAVIAVAALALYFINLHKHLADELFNDIADKEDIK